MISEDTGSFNFKEIQTHSPGQLVILPKIKVRMISSEFPLLLDQYNVDIKPLVPYIHLSINVDQQCATRISLDHITCFLQTFC